MKLTIKLTTRKDDNGKGNAFFLAKGNVPISIDLSKGVAFLVFTAEQGYEEMQISPLDEDCLNTSYVSVKNEGKLKIRIYPRHDSFGKTFYVGKIKMNGVVHLNDDIASFMVWNSLQNKEELQITGKFEWFD